jgi:hypothetical protein
VPTTTRAFVAAAMLAPCERHVAVTIEVGPVLPAASTSEPDLPPRVDPLVNNSAAEIHVVRGGGWNRSVREIHNAFRGAAVYSYEVPAPGFATFLTD